MATRRKARTGETRIAFDTLSIEGGLLSPEWISRVAQVAADAQSESDYRVPRGLALRDEIGRFWRIAQAHWTDFAAGRAAGTDPAALSRRFVTALLKDALGFESLEPVLPIIQGDHAWPIGHAALGGRVPIVVAPAAQGLDTLVPAFGDGGRRRSAFGLAQEALNAVEDALWGVATDGVTLRILRDNESLTRPAWVEADLDRVFTEQRYADFAALWLLAHETRFGRAGQPPADCPLEAWRTAGRAEGIRARDQLRQGVEHAVEALGQGFLAHPDNGALRGALHAGDLSPQAYFNELLRLVYRLIFLLTIEERGLLHPPESDPAAQALYAQGYGLRRLRDRSIRRSAHDRHHDLWEGVRIVFRGLAAGEPRLALPALAGLFAPDQCPRLDAARLENRALMLAMFRLSWLREDGGLVRVNWRDMGPEELGSVYESLLELVPVITQDGRRFAFTSGDAAKGNARKTTGSYYTPDSLVQVLLDSALEPVVADTVARHPDRPAEALLDLAIVDPACGSGHFLLAAARRLAGHVARHQAGGTPSAAEYRHAVRQVVGRCIHGVDLNPMAVELCRVGLWMEAVDPGRPLSFLDAHVRHGNALLGATPTLMAQDIPDEAFDPIEGDDKALARELKKRNRKNRGEQLAFDQLWDASGDPEAQVVARAAAAVDVAPDEDAVALAAKASAWNGLLESPEFRRQKLLADTWCAAFVWLKTDATSCAAAPENGAWHRYRRGIEHPPAHVVQQVERLANQYAFFHWHLAFPQVVDRGGFDVVLGNPPWERVKLQEIEFFAARNDDVAGAPNAAARKKAIAALAQSDPALWNAWCDASREAEGQSHFIRNSGRFPLCGRGDVNTYAVFAEHNRSLLGPRGRAGFIVPAGIATDDTTKEFFAALVASNELTRLHHFENEDKVFPEVHHAFRFILMTIGQTDPSEGADLVFFLRTVPEIKDMQRHFSLSASDFALLNPNTRTCPTFRSRRDAEINLALYRRTDVLWREDRGINGNTWGLSFLAMLHMANDSNSFQERTQLEGQGATLVGNRFEFQDGGETYLPLYEAKMVHHFDHRFGTYEGQTVAGANQGKLPEFNDADHADPSAVPLPRYWVASTEVSKRLDDRPHGQWFLGWRDICRATDVRTVIASIIPWAAVGHTVPVMFSTVTPAETTVLYANLCSFALDYAARQKVGGTHLTYGFLKQLPIHSPATFASDAPWDRGSTLQNWILPRVLELTYTAWDLEPFAQDVGWNGAPFRWDPKRRFLLRCELDAAFFHLYGLARDDVNHVMDTFPIVRRNDERAHGEYRTKRVILEIFDQMAAAVATNVPYTTRLDPPPADPRMAHPDTRGDTR